jgi:hypothetical protein
VVGELVQQAGVLVELVSSEQGAAVALVGDDALDGDEVVGQLGAVDLAAAVAGEPGGGVQDAGQRASRLGQGRSWLSRRTCSRR